MREVTLAVDNAKFSDVIASVCTQANASIGISGVELAEMPVEGLRCDKLSIEDVIAGLCRSYGLLYTAQGQVVVNGETVTHGVLRQLSAVEILERAQRDAEVFEDDEFEDADPIEQAQAQRQGGQTATGVGVDPEEVPSFRVASQPQNQGRPAARSSQPPTRAPKRRP